MTGAAEGTAFGAVLAGGEGRRFSAGRPAAKPGATVAGVSMAARALRALEPNVSSVGIVGPAASDDLFLRCIGVEGVPLRRDEVPGRGPLEGLRIALAWGEDLGADRVVVLPCDLPLVDAEVVGKLVRAFLSAPASRDALIPLARGRAQPLAGVYRVGVIESVERRIVGTGERSLRALLAELEVDRVEVETLGVDPERFLNVNREADLRRAERILTHRAAGRGRS